MCSAWLQERRKDIAPGGAGTHQDGRSKPDELPVRVPDHAQPRLLRHVQTASTGSSTAAWFVPPRPIMNCALPVHLLLARSHLLVRSHGQRGIAPHATLPPWVEGTHSLSQSPITSAGIISRRPVLSQALARNSLLGRWVSPPVS